MSITIPCTINPTINTEKYWEGMGRQNLRFHQALFELIDNAISAAGKDHDGDLKPFRILIVIKEIEGYVDVNVADDGIGISAEEIVNKVLMCGGQGNELGPLNEHGFGMKHALCTLTDNNKLGFEIRTRDKEIASDPELKDKCYLINGPFRSEMDLKYDSIDSWKKLVNEKFESETGTRIGFRTTKEYFKTVYNRNVKNFDTLIPRLAEHLGVIYRGYLNNTSHKMWLRWELEGEMPKEKRIYAINIPSLKNQSFNFEFEKEGIKAKAKYTWGICDKNVAKAESPWPCPLQIYYQHNIPTSGIDITVRGRVLSTCEIENLFEGINRGPSYNWLVGELELDENFRTVNNKTALDNNNFFWQQLINKLNYFDEENKVKPYVPKENADILSEKEIQNNRK